MTSNANQKAIEELEALLASARAQRSGSSEVRSADFNEGFHVATYCLIGDITNRIQALKEAAEAQEAEPSGFVAIDPVDLCVTAEGSAISVVHLPSQIKVVCDDYGTQGRNRDAALQMLAVVLHEERKQDAPTAPAGLVERAQEWVAAEHDDYTRAEGAVAIVRDLANAQPTPDDAVIRERYPLLQDELIRIRMALHDAIRAKFDESASDDLTTPQLVERLAQPIPDKPASPALVEAVSDYIATHEMGADGHNEYLAMHDAWAAAEKKQRDTGTVDQLAELRAERDELRDAAIAVVNATGTGFASERVSTKFLVDCLPAEVAALRERAEKAEEEVTDVLASSCAALEAAGIHNPESVAKGIEALAAKLAKGRKAVVDLLAELPEQPKTPDPTCGGKVSIHPEGWGTRG